MPKHQYRAGVMITAELTLSLCVFWLQKLPSPGAAWFRVLSRFLFTECNSGSNWDCVYCVLLNVQCHFHPWEKIKYGLQKIKSAPYTFYFLLLLVSENMSSAAFITPVPQRTGGPRDVPGTLSGKWNQQGCEVTASFPGPFHSCHLHKYRTPERQGLPCWYIVFRCSSVSSIMFFKLGHTK